MGFEETFDQVTRKQDFSQKDLTKSLGSKT